jgi:hypothetical protein
MQHQIYTQKSKNFERHWNEKTAFTNKAILEYV